MRTRVEKAGAVLNALNEVDLRPNIVVFPEYSFPLPKALSLLQRKADEFGFIIIGGADSLWQPDSKTIYNQSPIIIPRRKQPIWVTKRDVSQWEEGLVDEPEQSSQPLLVWEANGHEYWISTHICLDFQRAPDEFRTGGGIFIVPMCSSEVLPFLGWADALLRLQGGTATILCNCVGEAAQGQSGVVAVHAGGIAFRAAMELSTKAEQVAVFEIDLEYLSPPKKTPTTKKVFPLGQRYVYDIESMVGRVTLHEILQSGEEARKRGVINPGIFAVLGKAMRLAFINLPRYAEVKDKVKGKDYEVLAILGKEDIMVTHLADDLYDMIFDVGKAITWIEGNNSPVSVPELDDHAEDFPYFQIVRYFKVLGVPIDDAARAAYARKEMPLPNLVEIPQIFKLGERWEHADVSNEERKRFSEKKWILAVTDASPGNINAVMTVRLQFARTEIKQQLHTKFESKVIPVLLKDDQVTSLYGGFSPKLGIDYVLRLSINVENGFEALYEMIETIHDLALAERLEADTTTYIVVNRLAHLSLSKAVLVTKLARDKRYRDQHILPYLSEDDGVRLIYQSETEQYELIDQFRPVDEGLERIHYLGLVPDERVILQRKLAGGLFNKDFEILRAVQDPLHQKTEKALSSFLRDFISDERFKALKNEVEEVQSQKSKAQLNYIEKVKIIVRYLEGGALTEGSFARRILSRYIGDVEVETLNENVDGQPRKSWEELQDSEAAALATKYIQERGFLSSLKALHVTNKVRNALTHTDPDRLTLTDFTDAAVKYCAFLYAWREA